MSFEKNVSRIEEIVNKLESGECSLEEASMLFEEGKTLAATCAKTLDENKGKIVELVKEFDTIIEKNMK